MCGLTRLRLIMPRVHSIKFDFLAWLRFGLIGVSDQEVVKCVNRMKRVSLSFWLYRRTGRFRRRLKTNILPVPTRVIPASPPTVRRRFCSLRYLNHPGAAVRLKLP